MKQQAIKIILLELLMMKSIAIFIDLQLFQLEHHTTTAAIRR